MRLKIIENERIGATVMETLHFINGFNDAHLNKLNLFPIYSIVEDISYWFSMQTESSVIG